MIKKILKRVSLFIILLAIILFSAYHIQNVINKRALDIYNGVKLDSSSYALIRCNYNLVQPEYAYLYFDGKEGDIGFDQIDKILWSAEDWDTSSTGGTTIQNTTFPQLVKMVKEDCSQFQESYIDLTGYENYNELSKEEQLKLWPEIDKKNLGWTYTPYTPDPPKQPEPELTEEEKAELEALKERARQETIERRANAVPIEDLYK